jgi:hypothetical protein
MTSNDNVGNIVNSPLYLWLKKNEAAIFGYLRKYKQEILHFEHLIYANFLSFKA